MKLQVAKRPSTMARSKGASVPPRKKTNTTTYRGRFSARLRKLREAAGLDVESMVAAVNRHGYECSTAAYYHWENGTAVPRIDALPSLAKALGLTPADLLPDR